MTTQCSISQVSDKILSRIFVHYYRDSPPRYHSRDLLVERAPILQVCRRWQEVAYATPLLWRYINPFQAPQLTSKIIASSQDVPLHVMFHGCSASGTSNREALETVWAQSGRVRALQVSCDKPWIADIISSTALTSLRRLDGRNLSAKSTSLLFSENAPALRIVKLLNCELPALSASSPLVSRNITTLELSFIALSTGHHDTPISSSGEAPPMRQPPPIPDLFSLLAGLPMLRELALLDALRHSKQGLLWLKDRLLGNETRITFPQLHSLRLRDDMQLCLAFLETIKLPRTSVLKIQARLPRRHLDVTEHISAWKDSIASSYDARNPIQTLVIRAPTPNLLRLVCSTDSESKGNVVIDDGWYKSACWDLTLFVDERRDGFADELLRDAHMMLGFKDVKTLFLAVGNHIHEDTWINLFNVLRKVEVLHLDPFRESDGPCEDFVPLALSMPCDDKVRKRVPFPALRELHLHRGAKWSMWEMQSIANDLVARRPFIAVRLWKLVLHDSCTVGGKLYIAPIFHKIFLGLAPRVFCVHEQSSMVQDDIGEDHDIFCMPSTTPVGY